MHRDRKSSNPTTNRNRNPHYFLKKSKFMSTFRRALIFWLCYYVEVRTHCELFSKVVDPAMLTYCIFDSSMLLSSPAPVCDYLATYSDGTAILTLIRIYADLILWHSCRPFSVTSYFCWARWGCFLYCHGLIFLSQMRY